MTIQYLYVYNKLIYNLISKCDFTLIFILTKLLRNYYNKWFLFLNIKNAKLELWVYIRHA